MVKDNNTLLAIIYDKLGKWMPFTKNDYESAVKETEPKEEQDEEE